MAWFSRTSTSIDPHALSATERFLGGLEQKLATEPRYRAMFNCEMTRLASVLYPPRAEKDIIWFLGFRDMVERRAVAHSLDGLISKLTASSGVPDGTEAQAPCEVMVIYLRAYGLTQERDLSVVERAIQIITGINSLLISALDEPLEISFQTHSSPASMHPSLPLSRAV